MAIDWTGLLNAGINLYSSHQNANANQSAANQYAQQTKYNPYNISAGNSGVVFNGNNAAASLSPQYQQLQQQLTSGAGGLLGGLGQQYGQNGGVNPYLQSQFDQYNGQTMGSNAASLQPYGNLGPQLSSNVGDQFNATAGGFLGGLGSFDPNQAAQSYSQNLRAQAAPGNQLAAENTAQGLFNSGRLGSTGGANVLGQLTQAQNQQDLGFQIAGQQYGGQEQNRLAGLAQSFGQAGTGINNQMAQTNDQMTNSAFNRASTINQMQYNQVNQRADARFQNAMQLFGAGQQGLQNQLQGGLGMLQGSQGLDQNLLNTIGMGGYLGGASSNANSNAYNPSMQANVAGNNSKSAGLLNALGQSGAIGGAANWLNGLFGGGKGVSDALGSANGALNSWDTVGNISNGLQGMNMSNNDMWNGSGNLSQIFSGAGGQAANGISNGIQDLDYSKQIGDLAQPVPFNSDSGGMTLGKAVGGLTSGLNLYSGLKQGGVQGYGQALGAGAQLAGMLGYGGTTTGAAGVIGNLAAGNYIGAAQGAYGLLGGGTAATSAGAGAAGGAAGAGGAAAGSGAAAGGLSASAGASLAFAPIVYGLMNTINDTKAFNSPLYELQALAQQAQHGTMEFKPGSEQAKTFNALPANIQSALKSSDQGLRNYAIQQIQSQLTTGKWLDTGAAKAMPRTPTAKTRGS